MSAQKVRAIVESRRTSSGNNDGGICDIYVLKKPR